MGNNFFLPQAGISRVRLGLLCQDPEYEQVNVTGGRLLVSMCGDISFVTGYVAGHVGPRRTTQSQ